MASIPSRRTVGKVSLLATLFHHQIEIFAEVQDEFQRLYIKLMVPMHRAGFPRFYPLSATPGILLMMWLRLKSVMGLQITHPVSAIFGGEIK